MDNPAGLVSIAAVQSQNRSYVFYSKPGGNLLYLKSQTEREASSSSIDVPPYKPMGINVDDLAVTTREIRLYYISSQGYLQELCRSNEGPWKRGSLNNSKQPADPKSLLTASVDYSSKGDLKLYYNRPGESGMTCTWVSLGEQAWSSRPISSQY